MRSLIRTDVFIAGLGPAGASTAVATVGPRVNQDLPALAVLPLADLSQNGDFQYFADGVHEELLTSLSKVTGFLVLSRTSVMRYRATEMSMSEIAEQLGAAVVVEGSVRRDGEQVRVTLQLIDAQTGAHVWAENYGGELTDVFALQAEIARVATKALEAALVPVELSRNRQPAAAGLVPH